MKTYCMNKKQVKKRIEKLKKLINHYSYQYHVLDKPVVSDAAWDSLKKELADLEKESPEFITPDSPTQRVSGKALSKFKKVKHEQPMLSLQDAFSFEEIKDWETRLKRLTAKKIDYYAELKIDGLAVSLIYKKGVLFRGSTRGDGRVGEDVTQNLKTINSIPLRLREEVDCEIRGEAFISKKNFKSFSKKYANPRNLAAGSIRQLDSGITASRHLDFMAWQLLGADKQDKESEKLIKLGVKPVPGKYCGDLSVVKEYFESIKRDELEYEIDGLVVSINDNHLMKELGVAGKSPRGAIAWKFPSREATTIVNDVRIQVGRTGVLTPVAILEPVKIGGVTISRATLHNKEEIKKLGLKIGDTVIVGRAGDVIPYVKKVLKELRAGNEKNFVMPSKCPMCGKPVEEDKGGILFKCVNLKCPARQRRRLYYFSSKSAFDIEGLGPKIISALLDNDLIQDAADIFDLKEGDLLPLERFAEKSAENLVEAIQKSREITLPRLIIALGIHHVGEETAADLAETFGSMEKFKKAGEEELTQIRDIGPVVAQSIHGWFNDEYNKKFLERLLGCVEVAPQYVRTGKNKKFAGKSFVLTGSLESMARTEAKEHIRKLGGNVNSSVSKETDYVVAGSEPGSKYAQAKKLGVKIISETEFKKMIK